MVRMVDLVKDNDDRKRDFGKSASSSRNSQGGDEGGISFVAASSLAGFLPRPLRYPRSGNLFSRGPAAP